MFGVLPRPAQPTERPPIAVPDHDQTLVVVAREVTERKQLEAQLAQSDRLASVGVLAAGVAHEINNPLVYIMNNLSYVLTHMPDGYDELVSEHFIIAGTPDEVADRFIEIYRSL